MKVISLQMARRVKDQKNKKPYKAELESCVKQLKELRKTRFSV